MKAEVPPVESREEFHNRKIKSEVKHRMQRIRRLAAAVLQTTDPDHLISCAEEIMDHADKLRLFCQAIKRLSAVPPLTNHDDGDDDALHGSMSGL